VSHPDSYYIDLQLELANRVVQEPCDKCEVHKPCPSCAQKPKNKPFLWVQDIYFPFFKQFIDDQQDKAFAIDDLKALLPIM
jgi:hypothetical protein